MKRNGNRHTAATRSEAIRAYKANEPIKAICYDLGVSEWTLHRWLREADEPRMRYPVRVERQLARQAERT